MALRNSFQNLAVNWTLQSEIILLGTLCSLYMCFTNSLASLQADERGYRVNLFGEEVNHHPDDCIPPPLRKLYYKIHGNFFPQLGRISYLLEQFQGLLWSFFHCSTYYTAFDIVLNVSFHLWPPKFPPCQMQGFQEAEMPCLIGVVAFLQYLEVQAVRDIQSRALPGQAISEGQQLLVVLVPWISSAFNF